MDDPPEKGKPRGELAKLVHEQVLKLPINEIAPSPENTLLYRPVTPDDEATIALAESIRVHGILEPIVISADRFILSGHRRHVAARIIGLSEVPCRMIGIRRVDNDRANDEFVRLLRQHNKQRIKTRDELIREAIVSDDPKEAHRALTAYRRRKERFPPLCQSRCARQGALLDFGSEDGISLRGPQDHRGQRGISAAKSPTDSLSASKRSAACPLRQTGFALPQRCRELPRPN